MFDPDAHMPRINRGMVYLGACLIAGIRLARERQVNVRVVPTGKAIEESVELACEIFNRVFRRVPEQVSCVILFVMIQLLKGMGKSRKSISTERVKDFKVFLRFLGQ
jgi:hypothetical protein